MPGVYAREARVLSACFHEASAHHADPELLRGVHVPDGEVDMSHSDANLIGFDEWRRGGCRPQHAKPGDHQRFHQTTNLQQGVGLRSFVHCLTRATAA